MNEVSARAMGWIAVSPPRLALGTRCHHPPVATYGFERGGVFRSWRSVSYNMPSIAGPIPGLL
jgi:hypothetical protein